MNESLFPAGEYHKAPTFDEMVTPAKIIPKNPLDDVERAAKAKGHPTKRLSASTLTVDLTEDRRIEFRLGGGKGLLRARVFVAGTLDTELVITPGHAVRSVL